jgi:hypothetical protein
MTVTQCALKYVGYLEHATPELLGIFAANVGKGGCTIFAENINRCYRWRNFQGLPWCAVFVHGVYTEALGAHRAAKLLGKPHPGTHVLARRMKRRRRWRDKTYTPKPGDVIFLSNRDNDHISHVGLVTGVSGGTVRSVEGNTVDPGGTFEREQGGAVALRERKTDDPGIVGYGIIRTGSGGYA